MLRPDMDAPGPLLDVHPVAIELGERFTTAGFRLFLVGGAVRDTLLGRSGGTNLDFSTDAKPAETITVLRGWAQYHYLQGIQWGTVVARKDGFTIDITTFRPAIVSPAAITSRSRFIEQPPFVVAPRPAVREPLRRSSA